MPLPHFRRVIRRTAAKILLSFLGSVWLWTSAFAQQPAGYELALVDLRGKKQLLGTLPGSVFAPRVSPDGRHVAFELADAASGATPAPTRLYVAELARLDQRRALPLAGNALNRAPIWFPDGERLVFLVSGDSPDALWSRRADGTGSAERLVEGRAAEGMTADGRQLVFITRTGTADYGLSLFDLASRTVSPLVDRANSDQHSSRLSPDGHWLAYASNETGRHEIWLTRMPPDGQRFQLTDTGGGHPLWSPDGTTLYFDRDGQMFRVPIFLGATVPKAGEPKALPIRGFQQGELRRQFDLLPDGKHFLMLFPL